MGDSGLLFLCSIFNTLLAQGDYMVLGIVHSAAVVGIYFFAFNLSMQTMTLVTLNLGTSKAFDLQTTKDLMRS